MPYICVFLVFQHMLAILDVSPKLYYSTSDFVNMYDCADQCLNAANGRCTTFQMLLVVHHYIISAICNLYDGVPEEHIEMGTPVMLYHLL